jgi:S1-C subfamily serine protease
MSAGAIAVAGAIAAIALATIVGFAAGFLGAAFGSRINPLLPSRVTVVGATTAEPVAAAAAAAMPTVVNIDTTGASTPPSSLPTGHPDVPMMGNGSGVAYKPAPNGGTFIITNDHVVEGATTIKVTDAQGISHPGTVVGADKESDIAVVRIAERLPTIRLGDSNTLIVGQLAVAIGSPFGLDHSVSSGVVSAIHRSLNGQMDFGSSSNLLDVIQTDAAINPGNSGGALVDRVGRLIGINTAIFSQSGSSAGVGFAIPVNTAVRVANDLITKGVATHPFLGVQGRSVDATLVAEKNLPVTQGAWIEKVLPGGSAQKAGLKADDVIVQVGGREVKRWEDLQSAVRDLTVGNSVDVTIYRRGVKQTLTLTIGQRPK